MWQAGVGALIGYLLARWWVRRDARRELEALRAIWNARIESRDDEIVRLRTTFENSQRAVAAYERRARFLESALTATAEEQVAAPDAVTTGQRLIPTRPAR